MAEAGAMDWARRDAAGIVRVAIWLLYASVAASVVAIALAWRRGFDPLEVDQVALVFSLAEMALILIAAIVVLRWLYVANANARALGAHDMMVSPGWAVGWFFVPFANLVMPFIAVRELWKASARPRDWQLAPAPIAIPLWWAFWVASGIAGGISAMLGISLEKEAAAAGEVVAALSELLSIPAALLLAWIIGGVQRLQTSPEHLRDRFA